ncbi:MAG TPA: MarR family transcriptional regulator [Nocardioides sp.]|uniref:MarR family winged helix-turn-helix transcriptional regulator n=1 Tax=uncultured Nocardioides sp. TaxID=198441 RepID=UPI000ECD4F52|nr:MarR family transcriptional regulator [uncultured Nocardioides sp.]HCB04410.1 MarR family transcriptional regulator [Nocardioides sp.]HRD59877.1 MarR family transcriptional regulator [Nocardioides sp.]HRI95559.1 MarR family transcriptional regulator [Nocardioides sp.]
MTDTSRPESLRHLEREVGVLIRRVKRVIGERARAVHEDLQPASYLMLTWLVDQGPVRASSMVEKFNIDKGAVSRQLQHLDELGLVERTPDPADGRATLVAASDDAVRRLADVAEHRRKWLDEQLGDWTADELAHFADLLERYNHSLGV